MRMKWQTVGAVLAAIVGTIAAVAQTTADGEITGRISDSQWAALPGARVTVSLGDDRREAITDSEGRFAVRSLAPGTYRVTVDLTGFIPRSSSFHLTPASRRAHVEWRLEVGCLDVVDSVRLSAREAARMVDAIVHVRVESDNGSVLWSERPECTGSVMQDHSAQILNVVPKPGGALDGRTHLRLLMSPRDASLEPGSEYLVLLWQATPQSGFWRTGDGLVLRLAAGRVVSPAGDVLTGMAVADALETLGRWSRER